MLEPKSELDVIQVIVMGAFATGKTQFIQTMSEIEVTSRTMFEEPYGMAFDFGCLTINEHLKIHFFGTPGARRVDKEVIEHTFALLRIRSVYIVLFRNWKFDWEEKCDLDIWRENTAIVLNLLSDPTLPIIALLNESATRPIEFTADTLHDKYTIPSNIPIFTCDVTNAEQSKKVLIEALKLLPQDDIVKQAQDKLSETK